MTNISGYNQALV